MPAMPRSPSGAYRLALTTSWAISGVCTSCEHLVALHMTRGKAHNARGQTEGHRGIIGPLPGPQVNGSAAHQYLSAMTSLCQPFVWCEGIMVTLSPIAPSWTPLRPCPRLMGMITLAPLVSVVFTTGSAIWTRPRYKPLSSAVDIGLSHSNSTHMKTETNEKRKQSITLRVNRCNMIDTREPSDYTPSIRSDGAV